MDIWNILLCMTVRIFYFRGVCLQWAHALWNQGRSEATRILFAFLGGIFCSWFWRSDDCHRAGAKHDHHLCSPSWRVTSNAPLSFIAPRSVVISKFPVCSWVPRTFSPTSPWVSHRKSLRGRSQARQQEKNNADFYATLSSSHRGARRTELKIKRKHKTPRFFIARDRNSAKIV